MNELILLSALLRGPTYGYSLKKTAGLIFGSRTMHPNVVYPLLRRFTENGWVEQTSRPGDKGQTRKQYRITSAGVSHLLGELRRFDAEAASDDGAFLFRIALFDMMSKEDRQAILAARKSFLIVRAEQLEKLQEATHAKSFGRIALERVRYLVQDELRWMGALEKETAREKGEARCKPQRIHPVTAHQS